MRHELKISPQYFCRVVDGSKTFEVRNNDRGFQSGDTVILREWSLPSSDLKSGYSGREEKFTVGYVLQIDAERVVFSLLSTRGEP